MERFISFPIYNQESGKRNVKTSLQLLQTKTALQTKHNPPEQLPTIHLQTPRLNLP